MTDQGSLLRVVAAAGDRYPRAFWWRGRLHRVLGLQGLQVVRGERRYRFATREGCFELGRSFSAGWQMRHAPGWLERALAGFVNGPRYPLPAWRRRHFLLAPAVERRPVWSDRAGPADPAGCAQAGLGLSAARA